MEESVFARSGCFPWMPRRGDEMLRGCFGLGVQTLAPGERCATRGRLGCLLQGEGRLNGGEAARSGIFFGAALGPGGEKIPVEETLEARTVCLTVWLDFDVSQTVCYAACWFHVRLLQELERGLAARRPAERGLEG